MKTLVEKGEGYRIFFDKLFGLVPYYLLEDTRNAVQKQGTWIGVKTTKHYCKPLIKVKRALK